VAHPPRNLNTKQIERIRKICLALPEAAEQETWATPTFRVRNKIFAMCSDHSDGDGKVDVWCKAPPGVQQMLVEFEPERFFVPPYVGPKGWIGLRLAKNSDAELKKYIVQSYGLIAPKKLLTQLVAAPK
jgi:hypothetical protein